MRMTDISVLIFFIYNSSLLNITKTEYPNLWKVIFESQPEKSLEILYLQCLVVSG